MRTAVIFASTHGTTDKIVHLLAENLHLEDIDILDLKVQKQLDLTNYDLLIIGGSIHYGKMQKSIKELCEQHKELLLQKKLALFMVCMAEEKEQEEFELAFPPELRSHSMVNGIFGGEMLFEKMTFMEKMIVRKVAKVKESVSKIRYDAINEFTEKINKMVASDEVRVP